MWILTVKRFFLIIVLICISSTVFAQEQFNRKQKKEYEEADIFFEFGDYHTSLDIYQKLHASNPDISTITCKIGICLFNIKGSELNAQPYFESVRETETEASFYLGRIYHLQEKFDPAIVEFNYYKTKFPRKISDDEINRFIRISERAKEMILNPVNVSINNLGPKINSPSQDYVPLISADESVLYFTSRRAGSTGNLKDPLDEYFEDIYVSHNENGEWQEAINIGLPVNTNTHDATVSLSSNGSTLIFYRTNETLISGDLFITELKNGAWSEPLQLGSNINSEFQEASACLSPDERTLIFSSNNKNGYGGKDLFRVILLPNGSWSLPMNLGPAINTPYDEDAPFMHIDGKTLYFSSNGHNTMGGYDIFKSTYNDTQNKWEIPENIGYPINTVQDDIYFTINADSSNAYYSTLKARGMGRQDIYKINMHEYETGTTIIQGKIKDSISQKPIGAIISVIDNEFGDIQGAYSSNSSNGKFILTLQPGKRYQMVVEADGFTTKYMNLEFTEEKGYYNIPKEILLQPK